MYLFIFMETKERVAKIWRSKEKKALAAASHTFLCHINWGLFSKISNALFSKVVKASKLFFLSFEISYLLMPSACPAFTPNYLEAIGIEKHFGFLNIRQFHRTLSKTCGKD